jgi:hypothetical protein
MTKTEMFSGVGWLCAKNSPASAVLPVPGAAGRPAGRQPRGSSVRHPELAPCRQQVNTIGLFIRVADPDPPFTLMRIQIPSFTLMLIRILPFTLMLIRIGIRAFKYRLGLRKCSNRLVYYAFLLVKCKLMRIRI